jgi:hypothetical protein
MVRVYTGALGLARGRGRGFTAARQSPRAASILDSFQQSLFAFGAVFAAVAGQFRIAKFSAAFGQGSIERRKVHTTSGPILFSL